MKRSALALGASVVALALGAGPAQAAPEATQSVDDTTGAAQVGAVAVNAPVRVASDGDSQAAGAATAAPQTTSDSSGGAQVSSVDANAPVRVLSDGDDSGSAGSGAGSAGDQSTGESQGSAQVGSPGVNAPVRVASDGDSAAAEASAATTDGSQTVGDSSGAAQVGSPRLFAPVTVLGDAQSPGSGGSDVADEVGELLGTLPGDEPGGAGSSTIGTIASLVFGGAAGAGSPTPQQTGSLRNPGSAPYRRPVVNLFSGGAPLPGDGGAGSEVGDVSTLAVAGGDLPLTGAGVIALIGMGLSLLSSGAALRRAP